MFMFLWLLFFLYLLFMQLFKLSGSGVLVLVNDLFYYGFEHQGLQSSIFFKVAVCFLLVFWLGGMVFPVFSPWACVGYLFFLTNFSWLGVRTFTLIVFSFMLYFEEEHGWNWVTSLIMFFSHWLSFLISGVALTLRISIIFLMGHFVMFTLLDFSVLSSFFILLFILPIELFFAFLQSYIFLTLICMFLLNMI